MIHVSIGVAFDPLSRHVRRAASTSFRRLASSANMLSALDSVKLLRSLALPRREDSVLNVFS